MYSVYPMHSDICSSLYLQPHTIVPPVSKGLMNVKLMLCYIMVYVTLCCFFSRDTCCLLLRKRLNKYKILKYNRKCVFLSITVM